MLLRFKVVLFSGWGSTTDFEKVGTMYVSSNGWFLFSFQISEKPGTNTTSPIPIPGHSALSCFIFPYQCLKMTLYYDSIVYVTLNNVYLFIVPIRLHAPEKVWTTYGLINICILKTKDYFSCVENENYNSFFLICVQLELFEVPSLGSISLTSIFQISLSPKK